jgi:hypothetical protein
VCALRKEVGEGVGMCCQYQFCCGINHFGFSHHCADDVNIFIIRRDFPPFVTWGHCSHNLLFAVLASRRCGNTARVTLSCQQLSEQCWQLAVCELSMYVCVCVCVCVCVF